MPQPSFSTCRARVIQTLGVEGHLTCRSAPSALQAFRSRRGSRAAKKISRARLIFIESHIPFELGAIARQSHHMFHYLPSTATLALYRAMRRTRTPVGDFRRKWESSDRLTSWSPAPLDPREDLGEQQQ